MTGSLNEATLLGNLCADPEVRSTKDGRPVVSLRLATNERWKDKATGEQRERAEYHNVVIFNEGLCGVAEKFLKKGSKCLVRGQLQTRKWQDQSGADRYSTEVVLQGFNSTLVLLDGREKGSGEGEGGFTSSDYQKAKSGGGPSFGRDDLDDEIPY